MGKYLRTLASDLLTLEVNTIIRENSSSAKMPSMRRIALLQIAENYRDFMVNNGYAKRTPGVNFQPKPGDKTLYFRWQFGGEYSFVELKRHASAARHELSPKIKHMTQAEKAEAMRDLQLLVRIEEKSSNLIGVFKHKRREFEKEIKENKPGFNPTFLNEGIVSEYQAFPSQKDSAGWNNDLSMKDINDSEDIEFAPDDITLIRKIWEIGLEQILLQTSIQIDGDVTTVMARDFVGMPERTQMMLMKIHEDSISSSSKIWNMLFETIGKLAGKAIHRIFDREAKQ